MQVKKNTLLLLACLVWTAAGSTPPHRPAGPMPPKSLSPTSCSPFWSFFSFRSLSSGRLVGKHTRRILGYWEDRQFFLRFFDKKSFLLMAGMMSLGMFLRVSVCAGPLPGRVYSGLGAALLLAGLLFGRNYGQALRAARP